MPTRIYHNNTQPAGSALAGPGVQFFSALQLLWSASSPRVDAWTGQLATFNASSSISVAHGSEGTALVAADRKSVV